LTTTSEIAPAKLNLALHVRGRRADGRHSIETIFAFCTDGDRLTAEPADQFSLEIGGAFADELSAEDNLVLRAAYALREATGAKSGAALFLDKRLPVASGLGGGSADAAAVLRLLTSLWGTDPRYAQEVAPKLGSDVPACLLSLPARGEGAGDSLVTIAAPDLAGSPVLLVNPRIALSTASVFAAWDGIDRGPLGNWREGRNDLERPAIELVPQIEPVLRWLGAQDDAWFARMSGSGASCFALFKSERACETAAQAVPPQWWRLATFLR
jgi:4-diphosphocytidyl-2-C-methyl-D-erythritol kinase